MDEFSVGGVTTNRPTGTIGRDNERTLDERSFDQHLTRTLVRRQEHLFAQPGAPFLEAQRDPMTRRCGGTSTSAECERSGAIEQVFARTPARC